LKLIADNIHILNPKISEALEEMDPEPIQALARKIENAGANAIDINPGPLRKNCRKRMRFFLESVKQSTDLPLFLDSPNPLALETGLPVCTNKPVLNGFSMEPDKLENILPLAVRSGTDIVGFLLHPDGRVPGSLDERLNLAADLTGEAIKAGLAPEKLIIDPVVVPVSWENGTGQARQVLDCVSLLPELLGFPVKTIVGLSNLTSGTRPTDKTLLLEETYLAMLAQAGLDMVLLNIFRKKTVTKASICDDIKTSRIWAY
jgi:5-methyltetrahydrofolate corrinoid/iron sulfur protein methyltransferase